MNLLLCGSNIKQSIETETTFSEGDKMLCEPGDGFCTSRLLEHVTSSAGVMGFFKDTYDLTNTPAFGTGEYAARVHPGMSYVLAEAEHVKTGEGLELDHTSDPEGKRYTEVWVSYYPIVQAFPEVMSSDANSLVTSTRVAIKPKIYPELIQSITLPGGSGDVLLSPYERIKMSDGGSKVVVYTTTLVLLYEWNGTGYDQTLIHSSKGTVHYASVEGTELIVTYLDGTEKIDFYTKTTSWGLTRTEAWPYASYDVLLYGSYIYVGGAVNAGIVLLKSDLSIFYEADNPNYEDVLPADYLKYAADNSRVVGIEEFAISYLGSPFRSTLGYTEFDLNSAYIKEYGGAFSEGYDPYLPEGEVHVQFTGVIMLRHPYGTGADEGFLIKTSHDELYPYDYLDGEYCASWNLSGFTQGGSYVFDEFLVNFSNSVFLAESPNELIELYSYSFLEHKKFINAFHPVKYPYYFVYEDDGIMKLIEPIKTHYNEVPDAVVTLKYTSASEVSGVSGFSTPEQAANTTSLWLISDDNSIFYKWDGASWVVESSITSGNPLQDFKAGCTSGFTPTAGTTEIYVKLLMRSAERDNTPEFPFLETVMTLSTFGSSDDAFLCDDSKVEIEHVSDTKTRVTSKLQEEVILSAQVCVIAPPYNESFDG